MADLIAPVHGIFIGRCDELDSFEANFSKFALFSIIGIPGIGKTTLMDRIGRSLVTKGFELAWIFCSERLHLDTFLIQMNKWLIKFGDNSFTNVLNSEGMSIVEKGEKLISILSTRKTALCIDDFHLVRDSEVLNFMSLAARDLTSSKILFTSRRKIHFPMEPDFWEITLHGFNGGDGAAFFRGLLASGGGYSDLSEEDALRIVELTEGHILSLRLIATLLLKGNELEHMFNEWGSLRPQLGENLVELLKRSMTETELRVLEILSTFHRPPLPDDLYAAMLSMNLGDDSQEILRSLEDMFVISYRDRRIFLHQAIRDYLHLGMKPGDIAEISLVCARNFMKQAKNSEGPEITLEAIYQFMKAQAFDEAVTALVTIREDLFNTGNKGELTSLINALASRISPLPVPLRLMEARLLIPLGKAVEATRILQELSSEASSPAEKLEVCKYLGTSHVTMGDNIAAMRCFRQCLELATTLRDSHEITLAHWMIGCIHSNQRNLLLALTTFQKCLEQCNDPFLKAKILSSMGVTFTALDRYDKAFDALYEALITFDRLNQKALMTFTKCNIGHLLVKKGELEDARKFSEEGLDMALGLGDSRLVHFALKNLGSAYEGMGDYSMAWVYYEKAMTIADKFGNPHLIASVGVSMANCSMEQGEYSLALQLLDKSWEIYRKIDDQPMMAAILSKKARIMSRMGEYQEAMTLIDSAYETQQSTNDKSELANLFTLKGNILKDRGNLKQARELFEKGLTIYNQIESITGLARIYHQLGALSFVEEDYDAAMKNYCHALRLAKKSDLKTLVQEIVGGITEIHIRTGKFEKARVLMEVSQRECRRIGSKKTSSFLFAQMGKLHSITGDYDSAFNFLGRARTLKEETGDIRGIVRLSILMGDLLYTTGKREEAMAEYQKGLHLAEEKRFNADKAMLKINIGKTLASLNRYQEAILHLKNALLTIENTNDVFLIGQTHGILYKLFEKRKMKEKENFHSRKYQSFKRKLSQEKQNILEKLVEGVAL
ncbi:MAG: hypothetical protein CVV64_05000 [Candidatus Wallbacteria bacterium HGW-Wallbacteria-1]|jgi:tetratricopeptide (TPR) repeat protein|uniref:NB-ARC domain-containing protein n=1 Tax=Candidatus Wallbacteria bacterium HGW-Wallbacteria-1 TaxID=2013854 RepID=A0A2N1PS06_9BACT|nr:MAG: hypothetical protein CVV64_05000 [Candidatus Wallbacteria bacterium HGW-Wallbacteria-1]